MSQTIGDVDRTKERLRAVLSSISEEMDSVERILANELRNDDPFVDELLKHGSRLGGKRMRPALLLLVAKASGNVTDEHLRLAAVIEMIHTATLVHDDVLDEADLRRHVDTVNSRWSNETSILLGDFLFSQAFYLASTLSSTFACQMIGRSTNITCAGELRQVRHCADYELSEAEYLSIIEGKTAELCACACLLGSHYAGASQQDQLDAQQAGRDFGIAFQITDDLLDLLGNEGTVGKSLGTDLEKQKPTLPLIHLLKKAEPDDREQVMEILTREGNHRAEALMPWCERYDVLQYARKTAADYTARATKAFAKLPPSPARDALLELTNFVITRQQ